MNAIVRPMWARLGRRGLLLILGGLSWLGVGISLIAEPRDRFSAPGVSGHALQLLDAPVFAYMWIIAGVITFMAGVFRDRRVTSNIDSVGFNTFLTPPLLWTLFFMWSFSVHLLSGGSEGSPFAMYSSIVWGLVSMFIIVVAGWPEPFLTDEEG